MIGSMSNRGILLASAAILVAACAPAAMAQNAAEASAEPGAASQDGSAAEGENDKGQVEEIIVTAQRREENLQRVPIAISAITGDKAEEIGLTGSLGISLAAPSLTINQTPGGAAAVTVRGVTGTGSLGDESPTSVYVDGVYLAGTPGLYFDLNNIERIEVLKGPQGTLFGRNSVGGSIQIITRMPEHEPSATISLGYANYNTVSGQLYATTGITDTLAIDVAAIVSHQGDGWGKNIVTGNDVYKGKDFAVRSKILWEPTPDTRIVASGSYSYVVLPQALGGTVAPGNLNFAGLTVGQIGRYNTDSNFDNIANSRQRTLSLNMRQNIGKVTLVSITGYENTTNYRVTDTDFSETNAGSSISDTGTKSFSQEVQLLSDDRGSPLDWIVGAYYFHGKTFLDFKSYSALNTNPSAFSLINPRAPVESFAGFGQATYEVLPDLKVTGGIRYTIDKHSMYGITGTQSVSGTPIPRSEITDKEVTYRVALAYNVTDNIMLYASNATGFKSGLYALTAPNDPPVRPTTVKAYEAGFKADLLDRRLRVNVSAFLNDSEDVQVRVRLPNNSGNRFLNATEVRAKGFDVDMIFVVSPAFSLRGGLSYLDSKYRSFPNASFFFPRPNGIGNVAGVGDASGLATVQSPEFVGNITATYTVDTAIGNLTFSATESHRSTIYFDVQNIQPSPPYDLVNLAAIWRARSDDFSVRLWMNNALNAYYYTAGQTSNFGNTVFVGPPRTYGVTLTKTF